MKFLIDTNILIPLEPARPIDVEPKTNEALDLARTAAEGGHQLYVHPGTIDDVKRDGDAERRALRLQLLNKYLLLPDPPAVSLHIVEALGETERGSNEWVDQCLLAALEADAVDFLVTEDTRLRRRATRLGLGGRVATTTEARSIIRDLFETTPLPPPAVQDVKAHALDRSDPIFTSLKQDYETFDKWLTKCKREHRQAWIA